MSTIVYVNGTAKFTFFFAMRFNITIVTNCDSLIVIHIPYVFGTLRFSSLKLENTMKKHVQNIAELKYGFLKLVVICLFFTRSDHMIPYLNIILVILKMRAIFNSFTRKNKPLVWAVKSEKKRLNPIRLGFLGGIKSRREGYKKPHL